MGILISLIMGTRLLTLFGGGLGDDAARVSFLPPSISIVHEEIRLNCRLTNAYSEELKKLVKTATPVTIYLFAEMRNDNDRREVKKITVASSLQYDLINKVYVVIRSAGPDTVRSSSLDSAMVFSSTFSNIPVARKSEVRADADYLIVSYAILGKTKIDALNDKEVDLMYYWDFKRPNFKTEKISGREFIKQGVP
jgi:hypothetical protein